MLESLDFSLLTAGEPSVRKLAAIMAAVLVNLFFDGSDLDVQACNGSSTSAQVSCPFPSKSPYVILSSDAAKDLEQVFERFEASRTGTQDKLLTLQSQPIPPQKERDLLLSRAGQRRKSELPKLPSRSSQDHDIYLQPARRLDAAAEHRAGGTARQNESRPTAAPRGRCRRHPARRAAELVP